MKIGAWTIAVWIVVLIWFSCWYVGTPAKFHPPWVDAGVFTTMVVLWAAIFVYIMKRIAKL